MKHSIYFSDKFKYSHSKEVTMMDLECRNCEFKFRKEKIPPRCPYCSREGSVGLLKTAQDLLDETFGEARLIDEERKRRNA